MILRNKIKYDSLKINYKNGIDSLIEDYLILKKLRNKTISYKDYYNLDKSIIRYIKNGEVSLTGKFINKVGKNTIRNSKKWDLCYLIKPTKTKKILSLDILNIKYFLELLKKEELLYNLCWNDIKNQRENINIFVDYPETKEEKNSERKEANKEYALKKAQEKKLLITEIFNKYKNSITVAEIKKLKEISSKNYYEYLETKHWKIVRDYKIVSVNSRCQVCNTWKNLNVHHRTYIHLGEEFNYLEDLTVLCFKCHEKFHKKGTIYAQKK